MAVVLVVVAEVMAMTSEVAEVATLVWLTGGIGGEKDVFFRTLPKRSFPEALSKKTLP